MQCCRNIQKYPVSKTILETLNHFGIFWASPSSMILCRYEHLAIQPAMLDEGMASKPFIRTSRYAQARSNNSSSKPWRALRIGRIWKTIIHEESSRKRTLKTKNTINILNQVKRQNNLHRIPRLRISNHVFLFPACHDFQIPCGFQHVPVLFVGKAIDSRLIATELLAQVFHHRGHSRSRRPQTATRISRMTICVETMFFRNTIQS